MAKGSKQDPETGITPKAADGEPNGDDAKMQDEMDELARKRAGNGGNGRPIDDQPEDAEPTEAEMFPSGSIPGDHAVTMKNIVPAGKGRKTEAKMGATAIPLRDGLVRYGKLVELLVTVEAGKVEEVPDLEEQDAGGERKLLGVKDVQRFRPVHVQSAASMFTLDQVLDILEQHFGVPRTADKVAEVFGPVTAEQRAAAAG